MKGMPTVESLIRLGALLARLRASKGFHSPSSFAVHSGLPVSKIRDLENGRYLGSALELEQYFKGLSLPLSLHEENGGVQLSFEDTIFSVAFDTNTIPEEVREYRRRLGINQSVFRKLVRIESVSLTRLEQSRLPYDSPVVKRLLPLLKGEVDIDPLFDAQEKRHATALATASERSFLDLSRYMSYSVWIVSAGLLPRFTHSNYFSRLHAALEQGAEHYYFVPQKQYASLGMEFIRSIEEHIPSEVIRDRLRLYVAPPISFLLGQEIAVLHPAITDKRKIVVTNNSGMYDMPPHKYFEIFCYLREVVEKLEHLFAEGKQNRAYHGFYRLY